MIFNRGDFTEVWFRLESNEALGILDTDYIEDYYGTDGQLTLVNTETLTEYPVLMSPSVDAVSGDILIGYHSLNSLGNGEYVLKGRVRDVLGNYTILTDYIVPDIPNTLSYSITISSSTTYSSEVFNGLRIMGGMTFRTLFRTSATFSTRMYTQKGVTVYFDKNYSLSSKIQSDAKLALFLNIDGVQL